MKLGQKQHHMTTEGWKLLVRFKDEVKQCIPLKTIKETNPVEVSEFDEVKGIDDEVAFVYWVPHTLQQRDRIIASVSFRLKKQNFKCGIMVPISIEEAKQLDHNNGNTLWMDAIEKEMANAKVAFDILQLGDLIPVGWKSSSGHLVFDVKMDSTWKSH